MKYFFNFLILSLLNFQFISCQKDDFLIENDEVKILSSSEIWNSEITRKFLKSQIVAYERGKYNEEFERISKDFKDKSYKNLKGLKLKLSIKNNSNEVIEESQLAVLITFEFNNASYNYIKPYNLKGNWKPNEIKNLSFTEILNFANGDVKIIEVHKPKSVIVSYYLSAKNSVGYNNVKDAEKIHEDDAVEAVDDSSITISDNFNENSTEYGNFNNQLLSEEDLLLLGEKIFTCDITKLWFENPKKENSNVNLDNTFNNSKSTHNQVPEGWEIDNIKNGNFTSCYNFNPVIGNIDNYLDINVGGGTDVAIKIMNVNTNQCIRYVFVKSNSSYRVENIPEGEYYLKIAYGKNWISNVKNNQCIGKFKDNRMYEKGTDLLDFNISRFGRQSNVPSYELSLDIISSNIENSFQSKNISENEFNE